MTYQKRSVSSDIQNCKHWKFETTEDPHFADVHVKLKNVVSKTFWCRLRTLIDCLSRDRARGGAGDPGSLQCL